ncbi:hypothetical protein DDZ13_08565 [Coraliomargarita sinensis]|uniref:WD40 repeat domain-containing protein n=2 Tax=Coraliomargarita sinensis TaxID=2174842 RepID=A0A317ZL36_9BACT|nr:hypothetical protein DDZ13_08565 [Coraliomargarita sinensis]
MKRLGSDGREIHDFGQVGPVACPVAYDPVSRKAYRYVCASGFSSMKDFSQIRAFSMQSGEVSVVQELPLNQWVLWFLEWVKSADGKNGQLLGIWATDRPIDGQVCIEHRLFVIDPDDPNPKFRPLCRDAYKPLAFCRRRRTMAFSGAEGAYLVGLRGERIASLGADQLDTAHGGSFDPSGRPQVALGGNGIHLWNFETNSCSRFTRHGRHPVWSSDGQSLWYAGSSAALMRYDFETGRDETVIAIQPDRFPDFWKSRAPAISRCGRFLAAMLSTKRLKGVTQRAGGIETRERIFSADNCLCILDLQRAGFWRIEGSYYSAFRWI